MLIPNNILTANDSSFETSVGTWVVNSGPVGITRQTTGALDGTEALKYTFTGTGAGSAGPTAQLGVVAGVEYTAYGYMSTTLTGRVAVAQISWFTALGVQIGSAVQGASTALIANASLQDFVPVQVSAVAPSGASYAIIAFIPTATVSSDVFYLDWVAFVPGLFPVVGSAVAPFTTAAASFVTTYSSTAGNTLVAAVAFNQSTSTTATLTSVTDSASNVWTKVTDAYGNAGVLGSQGVALWICTNAAHVTTVTCTLSVSCPSAVVNILELSSSWVYATSPVEFAASASLAAVATSVTSPITPNIIGDLVISLWSAEGDKTGTSSVGTPQLKGVALSTSSGTQTALVYQPLTTTGVAITSGGTSTSGYQGSLSVALRATPFITSITPNQSTASNQLIVQGLTGYGTVTINRTNTVTGAAAVVRAANATATLGDAEIFTDYEATLGIANNYQVVASNLNPNLTTTTAASASASATIPTVYGETWIKNPFNPAQSMLVNVVGPLVDVVRAPLNTVYPILGTPYPVVVGDVLRARTGTLTVYTQGMTQYRALLGLLNLGTAVLFQANNTDNFDDMYFLVTGAGVTEKRVETPSSSLYRVFDLPFTEVASPSGSTSLLSGNTWSNVLSFATCANVLAWRSSCLALIEIPFGSGSPE